MFARAYSPGDYRHVNYLYRKVTGTIRSKEEYEWEWINTWDGPGSVWLVFDDERKQEDQLIGQYSLIPTPVSFWGSRYKAGKTENCMSHPDFRGKGMYFHHEQKYFEEAKQRYQVFFTTTGDVARGAPGKVRQKLGYRAFDYWVTYSLWLDQKDLINEAYLKMPRLLKKFGIIGRGLSEVVAWVQMRLTTSSRSNLPGIFSVLDEAEAPLDQIETLWTENAQDYGISIERTAKYMKWRINENPYITHKYLCYYENKKLKGYIIYTSQDRVVHIVDILASAKEELIFRGLFHKLKEVSSQDGMAQLKCYTASKNKFLIDMLRAGKFKNFAELFQFGGSKKKKRPSQLFVYVSEEIETDLDLWDSQYWYLTDLVKEGRPYTARLLG